MKWWRTQNVVDGNVGRVKFSFVCSVFTLSRDSRLNYEEKKKKRRMEGAEREREKEKDIEGTNTAQRKRKKNRETHADRYESFSEVLTDVLVVDRLSLSFIVLSFACTWDIVKVIGIKSLTARRDSIQAKKNGKRKITDRVTLRCVLTYFFLLLARTGLTMVTVLLVIEMIPLGLSPIGRQLAEIIVDLLRVRNASVSAMKLIWMTSISIWSMWVHRSLKLFWVLFSILGWTPNLHRGTCPSIRYGSENGNETKWSEKNVTSSAGRGFHTKIETNRHIPSSLSSTQNTREGASEKRFVQCDARSNSSARNYEDNDRNGSVAQCHWHCSMIEWRNSVTLSTTFFWRKRTRYQNAKVESIQYPWNSTFWTEARKTFLYSSFWCLSRV